MALTRRELDAFLDDVHRRVLVLGAEARLRVHALHEARPELELEALRPELGASIASLLARDAREYAAIRDAFSARFVRAAAAPRDEVGGGAAALGIGIFAAVILVALIVPPTIVHPPAGPDAGPVDTGTVARDGGTGTPTIAVATGVVPLVPYEGVVTATVSVTPPPRTPDALDWAAVAAAVVALVLGELLLAFALLEPRARKRDAEAKIAASDAECRRIEREILALPVERKRPSRFGLDRAVVVETASLLQRLAESTYGPGLDPEETARVTARNAGMFTPVLEERRHPVTLTVLVDAESGDHVWYGAFLRVLEDWGRQGVVLDVHRFSGHPDQPEHLATGRREPIDALARRARGPLVVFSRRLSRTDREGDARWVRALPLWPLAAWVDPEPAPGQMSTREVEALERAGLVRFPGTAEGLRALVRYLVSSGEVVDRVPQPTLPARDDPGVRRALHLWRTAVALVPVATWDFVERVRQAHPDVARAFPERHCVRALLDEVDAQDTERDDVAGRGSLLALSEGTYVAWGREADRDFVAWATGLHDAELAIATPAHAIDRAEAEMLRARNRARREGTLEAMEAFAVHRLGLARANAELEWRDLQALVRGREGGLEAGAVRLLGGRDDEAVSVAWRRLGRAEVRAWLVAAAVGLAAVAGLVAASGRVFERGEVTTTVRRTGLVPGVWALDPSGPLASDAATPLRPAMIRLPAGEFLMGSPDAEPGRDDDEGPQHRVRIEHPFWLAETELTQGQWTALVERRRGKTASLPIAPNPSRFTAEHGGGPEHPVEQVSWLDAVGFANLLSAEEGRPPCYRLDGCTGAIGAELECRTVEFLGTTCVGYRLPTEAEWEYAARGGTTEALYTGPIVLAGANNAPAVGAIGWYGGNSGLPRGAADCTDWTEREDPRLATCGTHPVRTKVIRPHPWGLADVIGNVYEWTNDARRSYPAAGAKAAPDPGAGPWQGLPDELVLRGCSWNVDARFCRAAYRFAYSPAYRYRFVGFRLARSDPRPSIP